MKRIVLALLALLLLPGCWDKRELESLFIVTAVGMDQAAAPGELEVFFQIAKADVGNNLLLKSTDKTVLGATEVQNRDSSRTLLMQHNQVLLMGSKMAEEGVGSKLDLFLRSQQARMEVLAMVADGKAEEVLSAKLEQEDSAGIYLSRMMQELRKISPYYRERWLDFVSRLRTETVAPLAPVVTVEGEKGKQRLKITGMAVFKGDKMAGKLTTDETAGYLWAMGKVRGGVVTAERGEDLAVFHILSLDTKREVRLDADGNLHTALKVDASLRAGELRGFHKVPTEKLRETLSMLAEEQIKQQILSTVARAQELKADICGFSRSVQIAYPGPWKESKEHWDKTYAAMTLDVSVKAAIPELGQVTKTLEMEEVKP